VEKSDRTKFPASPRSGRSAPQQVGPTVTVQSYGSLRTAEVLNCQIAALISYAGMGSSKDHPYLIATPEALTNE
jgi:hypothetical protein